MEWHPDVATRQRIKEEAQILLARLRRELGIDELIPGCEVIDLDPDGVGAGTTPRYVTVTVNEYHVDVLWRGYPAIAVGDDVIVIHFNIGDLYEILGAGGTTSAEIPLESLAGYARGYLIRGGIYDWESFPAHLYGYILVGDGVDVNSVPMHGDATIRPDGHVTVSGGVTSPVARGDMLRADATLQWERFAAGLAHQILKMDAAGNDPNWEPFDWDEMAAVAGADMVHSHQSNAEGGQLSGDVIADDISGDTEDNTNFTLDLEKAQAANVYAIIRLIRERGTIAAPTAVQNGDILGRLAWRARNSGAAWQNTAFIEAVAGENHTVAAQGTRIVFYRRLTGTAVDDQALALAADGNVRFDLGDAAGVDRFIIRDSGDVEVFGVTSDGAIDLSTSICVRVRRTASQNIADITLTAITWQVEDWDDVDDNWAAGNPTRLTAQRDGNYAISFGGEWDNDVNGFRQHSIRVNGVTIIAVEERVAGDGSSGNPQFCMSTRYKLSATDYVEALVYQNSGGALNFINNQYTFFEMTRIP